MSSLSDGTGTPLAEVRSLFAQELAELELGAKVRSYLTVLTTSKVRATLRRNNSMVPKARRVAERPQRPDPEADRADGG